MYGGISACAWRGWCLLGWLHMCIPAIALALASAWWGMFGPGTPGLGIPFLEVVTCSALAAINVLTDQQPDWPRIHRAIGLTSLLLAAASSAFILMAASRRRADW